MCERKCYTMRKNTKRDKGNKENEKEMLFLFKMLEYIDNEGKPYCTGRRSLYTKSHTRLLSRARTSRYHCIQSYLDLKRLSIAISTPISASPKLGV